MMNKKYVIGGVLLLLFIGGWFFTRSKTDDSFIYKVKKDLFVISTTTTGELEAKNSVKIMGPAGINNFGIWRVKIEDLIEEGTVVDSGDYVGALDKSELVEKLKTEQSNLLKSESKFVQSRLDTTLDLSAARNDIQTSKFALTEAEITLKQSKFEPPAIIRQNELNLEKTKKALEESKKNFKIKKKQAIAKMQEVGVDMTIASQKIDRIHDLLGQFTVTAPKAGMLIYKRDWDGTKKTVGSMVQAWSPVVATLPDMSVMVSKTFINEVEISKIKEGQLVNIGLDAFPEKQFKGKVSYVSNVGQESPSSDGKVFEVNIEVSERDSTLRPSMTTSNEIIISEIDSSIFIPLEALHNQGDSLNFVYKKDGMSTVKKEVKVGDKNENHVIIESGINENEEILLNIPEDEIDLDIVRIK